MPPEQAGGNRGEVGPAGDVYALGATLYALVTGRPPFQAATPMDTVILVIGEEPVPPRRLNATIPHDLETIVLKCLEKEPAKRFRSAQELAEELERLLSEERIRSTSWRLEPVRMGKWLGLGALIGTLVGVVLRVGWLPPGLIVVDLTEPQTPVVLRALGGCLRAL